jgi:predicted RNA-binding protein with PIN domain
MTLPDDTSPVVPDQLIADALDVAIGIAAAGAKLRPAMPYPAQLRPLFRFQKLPSKALADARQAIEGDPVFRQRIGSVVTADLVGEAGLLWLQRPSGWRERLVELAEIGGPGSDDPSVVAQLRRAERKREAAERAAAQALAELVRLRSEVAAQSTSGSGRARRDERPSGDEFQRLDQEVKRLQTELRHTGDRLGAAIERAERARLEAAESRRLLAEAERIRDDVLAARAQGADQQGGADVERLMAGAAWLAGSISEQAALADALAASLRRLADDVASLEPSERKVVAPTPTTPAPTGSSRRTRSRRRPAALPGGVYGTSREAAEHLVRLPGAVVLLDGYNVAKLGWPQLDLEQQRDRCIASAEDVARRFGADVRVVFDGADVPGVPTTRRLVRVRFTPSGVSADDALREAVASIADEVAVVVVTDDRAVLDDVRAGGANTLASRQWLELTGHISIGR